MNKTQNKKNIHKFLKKHCWFSIKDIALAGILVALYIISGIFIQFDLKGLMEIGITYVFLIMFGVCFGPIKGSFLALIADTFKLLIKGTIASWMWEYEMIAIGIPVMAWGFKYLFGAKEKQWWLSMIGINLITLLGMIVVMIITTNNPILHKASKHSFNFNQPTLILIYTMAALMILIQVSLFSIYGYKKNEQLRLIISFGTLVMMIIVVWIWIWGPIAYVRYLKRFGKHSSDYYTFDKYYKIALWARILKTPVIVPIYTAILIPLYKATEITLKKFNQNIY